MQRESERKAISTVGFIFIATLLAKVLGQLREIFIGNAYGTSALASAYFAASQIPTSFFDMILGSAISSAFIPVFIGISKNKGKEHAEKFASLFFNIVIVIAIVFTMVGILGASGIVNFIVSGMDDANKQITAELLKIMFPMVIFIAGAFTVVGVLQSYGSFKIPAIMSMVSSAICIVYLLTLNKYFGISGLAVSLLLGWALQFLVLLPSLFKSGYKYSWSFNIFDENIKQVALIALPVLFSTWVQPINITVNMIVASGLESGQAVAAINYANRLYLIVAGVFAVSLTNYMFPEMSRLGVSEKAKEWFGVVLNSIRAVAIFILPIMALFLVLAEPIIRLVYQRNAFDEGSVSLTSTALFFYSVGMLGFALQEVINKAFFSRKDSKTPMYISVGAMVVNVFLSFTLSKVMGIGGLALAASISATLAAAVSLFLMCKGHSLKGVGVSFIARLIIMTVCTGAVAWLIKVFCEPIFGQSFVGRSLLILASGAISIFTYIILGIVFRLNEFNVLLKLSKIKP